MVIRYGQLGNVLMGLMYKDRLTSYRSSTTINSDGSKGSKFFGSFLLNEPCLVHETSKDSSKDGNMDVSREETTVTIHCSPDCDIVKGDILVLSIMNDVDTVVKTIKGFASQPCPYPDHLEIDLYDWEVS